ncbi:MAG TPA: SusC/RagA family TonB-linked outer membrane protein [Cyclobacteriaceae bacterium]|nr:SusC/RagA family TonB-linked outer membrane protein [Cyclobacteriaceae bacterium]
MKQQYQVLCLALFFALASASAFAQRTVSGKVSDSQGAAMPGVNVVVKGTSSGTTTDSDGRYSISTGDGSVLVFSFIGFLSQEVDIGNRTSVDVTMSEDIQQLSEVVVTALGIERSTKALQSSVTQVSGDNFTQAREISAANALAGRVAGVNVTKIASGPASSSRVVIRGAKTLGSTLNQPLYVVDGIPMDNTNFGQAGVWGGTDNGDGLNSINPDDIQSMTVLKGASAAALYGSRAANGVILITTKRGSGKKGLGIEFNSNYVMEKVQNLTDFQHEYGNGGYVGTSLATSVAQTPASLDEHWNNWWGLQAWGPKFNGQPVVQWDGVERPYSYKGDNWSRYYETGSTFTNSLALTGGNENQNFRFSVADLNNSGIIPNSGFKRQNFSLATNSKFGEKINLNAKVMYSHEDVKNRPMVSDSPGNGVLALYYIPGDVNVNDMIGDPNKPGAVPDLATQADKGITIHDGKAPGEEFQVSNNLWTQNPWWTAYQFKNNDIRDRVIASGQLRYDITDFLYVQGTAGMDWYTRRGTYLTPQGTGYNRDGNLSEDERRTREINLEWILGFNKSFGKIGVNAFVGGNRMRRSYERISADGSGFSSPFFPAITNAKSKTYGYDFGESGINSLFGSAEISYNNYLFLTATVREDWFSTLNPAKNNIVYPSVGASFVFTEALNALPSWLSFGKVRLSWAQVGNAQSVQPYATALTYAAAQTHVGRPLGGFTSGSNYPNPDLIPFTSTETEFGFDVRFFDNRLGLDFTYYDQKTTDDILDQNISWGSGFRTTSVNLGKITNKGIEVLLTGTPIRGKVTWDVSLNFAKNNSNVVSLIEGQTEVVGEEPRTRTVYIKNIVGHPYGVITGQTQLRDPDTGLLVYNSDGAPITDGSYNIIGSGVPDFTGGLNNSFTYKQFNLTFLIDFKSGGDIYSGTNVRMTQAGFTKQTLQGRDGEAPLTVTGVTDSDEDGVYEPFTKTLTPGEAQNYWSLLGDRAAERFIYDASFVKLRQVTFGYSLPKPLLSKTPFQTVMVSFVARNLAILYKNVDNIDPESSYTSSNSQGLDYFGMPASRTYGFNLRVTF